VDSISDPSANPSNEQTLIAAGPGTGNNRSLTNQSGIRQVSNTTDSLAMVPVPSKNRSENTQVAQVAAAAPRRGSWYARTGTASTATTTTISTPTRASVGESRQPLAFRAPRGVSGSAVGQPPAGKIAQQTTRPQAPQTPRQIVMEWSRPPSGPASASSNPKRVPVTYYDASASKTMQR
jgi:hypothetical protein